MSNVFDLHSDVQSKPPAQKEPNKDLDILTLKKMVIDEIKSELQLNGQGKGQFPGVARPGYVDPFSRME